MKFTGAMRFAAIDAAIDHVYPFSRLMFLERKGYKWLEGPHHPQICEALMKVYRGETMRLIINVAPRYSKTELAVINFIAWCMGKCPDAEFIHTSYSSGLASNNAWQVREMVGHPTYREVFPSTHIRTDSKARNEWRTTEGGVVYAQGSGGAITGFGAGKLRAGFGGAIIIDDPHKANEARSDVMRNNVIEWFQNTLESRKNSPHTPIIVIMQRLHENDLCGWLLGDRSDGIPKAGGNGEVWEHIVIDTLQENGTKALWPAKHTVEVLKAMQAASPYVFGGQYQQRPTPSEGNVIKPDNIDIIDAIPVGTTFVRGWDFASIADDGDWTVGVKLGVMPNGRYLIADIVRLQGSPDQVEAALLNAANRDGDETRISIPQDPGQAGKAQVAYLVGKLAGFSVEASPESNDKVTRADPLASQINVGNVSMLKAEWNDKFINELRMFPNGKFDDQVDAASRAFTMLIVNVVGLIDYYEQQVKEREQQRIAEAKQLKLTDASLADVDIDDLFQ